MITILSITTKIDNAALDPGVEVDRRRYGGRMPTEITVRGSFFRVPGTRACDRTRHDRL
jgi:hypothetical protein